MSTMKYVMPSCFGASGSVRARQIPQSARRGDEVHTFCPLSTQPPVDALGTRGQGGEVAAGTGLAEELAPHELAPQRGPDPALLLLDGAVGDDRGQGPGADGQVRPVHPRRGQLLVDDQLLDGARHPAPRDAASAA